MGNDWIPVEERPPEENGAYFVTIERTLKPCEEKDWNSTEPIPLVFVRNVMIVRFYGGKFELPPVYRKKRDCEVTAWKPLDPPYERKEP